MLTTTASASCGCWTPVEAASPSASTTELTGAAATSKTNVWAVGFYNNGTTPANPVTPFNYTLVEHWNGTVWTVQSSPTPGSSPGGGEFSGVAATSPSNAWAVGDQANPGMRTLIEHWNGISWSIQASPHPGALSFLSSVTGSSAHNAWAAGAYDLAGHTRTLIVRWNGTAWKREPSPNPVARYNVLQGVSATSARNAWAIGYYASGRGYRTLVEHWNGTAWRVQRSPNPGDSSGDNRLQAVAATSAHNAWAVGSYRDAKGNWRTLILHWNGRVWKLQASRNPGSFRQPPDNYHVLNGVTATSANNAWTVGEIGFLSADQSTRFHAQTLVEHWNGTAWTLQPTPDSGTAGFSLLRGVVATSAADAWAVGYGDEPTIDTGGSTHAVTLHCCSGNP